MTAKELGMLLLLLRLSPLLRRQLEVVTIFKRHLSLLLYRLVRVVTLEYLHVRPNVHNGLRYFYTLNNITVIKLKIAAYQDGNKYFLEGVRLVGWFQVQDLLVFVVIARRNDFDFFFEVYTR